MDKINKVAVIGSGVMGSAIAAHIANSGIKTILLDIVQEDATDKNILGRNALDRLLKSSPAAFTHKDKAKLITIGNLEDNLDLLKDVDWVIEAVLEDINIKQDLYKKINQYCHTDTVISSNTSTIPLKILIKDMGEDFEKKFMITHFFNPPRYMRLFELVKGQNTRTDLIAKISNFADVNLGKGVVNCKDTAGFLANRLGCFWLMKGLLAAFELDIKIEEADLVMGKPFGIPKTGVFGLFDLIGIDLMPLIAKAFFNYLPKDDAFITDYLEPQLVKKMISDGYTGRKGKGGFYRLNNIDGKKLKEVINLKTGEYSLALDAKLASVDLAKDSLRAFLEYGDIGSKYAQKVIIPTLAYAASMVPEASDDILSIDEAMRLGYNWKYGPFELIDKLGDSNLKGVDWLITKLQEQNIKIPELLIKAKGNNFYKKQNDGKYYLNIGFSFEKIKIENNSWMLSDKKLSNKPVAKNPSAALWDIGDGILCLEYTSKMNSVDPLTLEMINKSIDIVKSGFNGLVIGNDADNFCVGANLGFLLFSANIAAWKTIKDTIKQGQDSYMALKYAPFPVVAAVSGMALGGGCEILLHSDRIVAHVETYAGLVEVGVGVIPGWGGCKEMILRHLESASKQRMSLSQKGGMFALSLKQALKGEGTASLRHPITTINTMPAIISSFSNIALAKVSSSAEEAKDMMILRDGDLVVMNRKRLLPDAKQECLKLSENYVVPKDATLRLPGATAYAALEMSIDGFVKAGKASDYDAVISRHLANVLSGGKTDITCQITEQQLLDLEIDSFMELIKNKKTWDRIDHMLETGKPLRN